MISYINKVVRDDMSEITSRNIPWENLKNKTILITGANGMLATYFIYVLMYLNETKKFNINIVALVRNEEKSKIIFKDFLQNKLFRLLVQDVCSAIKLNEEVNYIVHSAGNASPKFILSDPVGIIKANTIGTLNILELAKEKNIENVLYTSTREVYGKMDDNITEIYEYDYGKMDCKELRSCYPESKRVSETMLESYYHQFKVPFTVARIAHSYGPGMKIDDDGRVMADFISDIVNDRDIVLNSDGSAIRAFCYINDAVAGLFTVLLKGKIGEAYNIANENEPVMIREAATKLTNLFPEKGLSVVYNIPKEQSLGYSKMGRVKLNTNKLEELGWKCNINLEEGLYKTVHSFINN